MADPPIQKNLSQRLETDLRELAGQGLRRALRCMSASARWLEFDGRKLLNFAGNDYLALAGHPKLAGACIDAIQSHGTGAGASALVCGHLTLHAQIEARFAAFKGAPAAAIVPTGYQANLATLTALARQGDVVCVDKLCHASLIDGARFSGATVRIYPHKNLDKLTRLLERAASNGAPRWIVTDSVFSMDGDVADLPALCELAERFDAGLIVDEAHGTGVLGEAGRGLCELQGVSGRVDVVISTASKALGGLGGVVTGDERVIDAIVNRGRPMIYSTAAAPAQVAAIGAALEIVEAEPWRRERLRELAIRLRAALMERGLLPAALANQREGEVDAVVTPILPVIVGRPEAAAALAAHLMERGVYAPAIRPPTVAPGAARVRLTLRADHEEGDIDQLLDAIDAWPRQGGDVV